MSGKRLVIYHKDADGFCAAWLIWKFLDSEAEFRAAQYGDQPPTPDEVAGRRVLILDFSYDRHTLEALAATAHSLQVLDHHKAAADDLAGLDFVKIDPDKSGSRLIWEYLATEERPPGIRGLETRQPLWIVEYVEDRDLWRFALPESREVSAALRMEPFDFAAWDRVVADGLGALKHTGRIVRRYQRQVIKTYLSHARWAFLDDLTVPVVNISDPLLISDVLHQLDQCRTTYKAPNEDGQHSQVPFAASFFLDGEMRYVYSLRSAEHGADVARIAQRFGGGGHRHAAGFLATGPVHHLSSLPWTTPEFIPEE